MYNLSSLVTRDFTKMINYIKGDLFKHTSSSPDKWNILLHACNCKGSWGAGVAYGFKEHYPSAYKTHHRYCKSMTKSIDLLGTSQIIPSNPNDLGHQTVGKVLVACLFNSDGFGADKMPPKDIVYYTDHAMKDLIEKLDHFQQLDQKDGRIIINMPKINAGLFGVPWNMTEEILSKYDDLFINVYVL